MILHAVADEYQTQLNALTARHGISKNILFVAQETALSATQPTSSLPAGYERLVSRPAWLQACQKRGVVMSSEMKLEGVDI